MAAIVWLSVLLFFITDARLPAAELNGEHLSVLANQRKAVCQTARRSSNPLVRTMLSPSTAYNIRLPSQSIASISAPLRKRGLTPIGHRSEAAKVSYSHGYFFICPLTNFVSGASGGS